MRNALAKTVEKLAEKNKKLVILSGDIGNKLFDSYKAKFSSRFYNCGIAEANMTSVAAGLAMNNFTPITYTITPFNTTRCLEQIRNDICYHNLPAIIVGVGAGLSYGLLGGSHHALEDISFLRSIPNMHVVCPADPIEVEILLEKAILLQKPVYFRIGKKGEPKIHSEYPDLEIGKGHIYKKGQDIAIISSGNIFSNAIELAKLLETDNINAEIINMHTIKPIDTTLLNSTFNKFDLVISLEEHSLIGGLGSTIAEWMVDNNIQKKLMRFGTDDNFAFPLGNQEYLRKKHGLDIQTIREKICIQKLQYS